MREKKRERECKKGARRVTSKNPQNHAISQHIANLGNEYLTSQSLCIVLCFESKHARGRERERAVSLCIGNLVSELFDFKHCVCLCATV